MINEQVASLWPTETCKINYLSFLSGFKHTHLRFLTNNKFALVRLHHLPVSRGNSRLCNHSFYTKANNYASFNFSFWYTSRRSASSSVLKGRGFLFRLRNMSVFPGLFLSASALKAVFSSAIYRK